MSTLNRIFLFLILIAASANFIVKATSIRTVVQLSEQSNSLGKCLKELPNPRNSSDIITEEICCKGYKHDIQNNSCIPICEKDCLNGICTSPNICQCFPNHILNLSNDCIPTCPIDCLNGHCLSNGECLCNTGYILDAMKKFCKPDCPNGCGAYMNCTSPGLCTCQNGYELDVNGICIPICEPNCVNGKCTALNTCTCFSEYTLIDGVCQAKCEKECKNGKCLLTDVCICDPGYTFNETTKFCEPVCNECENGDCVAPDDCLCYEGFIKDGSSCKPICLNGCENGYCLSPYNCLCKDGFGKNPSGSCLPLECTTGFTEKECIIYHNKQN